MGRKTEILSIIFVLSLVGYGYTYIQVSSVIQDLVIDMSDFRLEGISIFPPSADIVFIFIVYNPSGYDLDLSIDAAMYYGNNLITPIDVSDTISANGHATFEVPLHITSEVEDIFTETSDTQLTLEGRVTITHRIFGFVPVVFTRTGIL